MIAVCAWCGKRMGIRGVEPGVTHGICPNCQEKVVREYRLERFGGEDRRGNQNTEVLENGGATEGEQGSGTVRSVDPGRNLRVDGKGEMND